MEGCNMNVRKIIKKIAVIGIGAMFIGSTLVGCADIKMSQQDYDDEIAAAKLLDNEQVKKDATKDMFTQTELDAAKAGLFTQEQLDAKVAEQKTTDDKVLADYKKSEDDQEADDKKTAAAAASVFYEKDELALNSAISFILDDSDLPWLQDKKIKFNSEKIDIHEDLIFGSEEDSMLIRTSIFDPEFSSAIYLTLEKENAFEYRYYFDDEIKISDINRKDSLEINFGGNDIEIIGVTTNSFTVVQGEKLTLEEGETRTITIDGEDVEVKVSIIADTAETVTIIINGESESNLGEEDSAEVGKSGYEVYIISVMPNEAGDIGPDTVEFKISKDVEIEYKATDEVTEDDDRYEYTVKVSGEEGEEVLEYLGITSVETSYDLDDDYLPITGDEKYVFAGLFSVGFSLTEVTYFDYDFKMDNVKVGTGRVNAIKITSSDDEGIVINNGGRIDEVDKIYFTGTTVIYDDEDGDEQEVNITDVKFVNDDTELQLSYNANRDILKIGDGNNIKITIGGDFEYLGATEDKAEIDDIKYKGTGYGTQDEDLVTNDGTIIERPEDNADNDKVTISVPSETVEATIRIEKVPTTEVEEEEETEEAETTD